MTGASWGGVELGAVVSLSPSPSIVVEQGLNFSELTGIQCGQLLPVWYRSGSGDGSAPRVARRGRHPRLSPIPTYFLTGMYRPCRGDAAAQPSHHRSG